MIQLNFSGSSDEVISDLFRVADLLATGRRVKDHIAATRAEVAQSAPIAKPIAGLPEGAMTEPAPEKAKRGRPAKNKTPFEKAAEAAVAEVVEEIETEAQPEPVAEFKVPTTVDEIRALVVLCGKHVGYDAPSAIIKKHAPNISSLTADQYEAVGRELHVAMQSQ